MPAACASASVLTLLSKSMPKRPKKPSNKKNNYSTRTVVLPSASEKLLLKGNEVMAEAAIQAGCRFFAGYPITPQNEIPEYMSWRMPEVGGVFIQAESELS